MIGGIAFGAPDCGSEVQADVFDGTGEDSANETVTLNSAACAELQAAGIDMAFHDLLLASGLDLETLQVKLPTFCITNTARVLFGCLMVVRFFRWERMGTYTWCWPQSWRRLVFSKRETASGFSRPLHDAECERSARLGERDRSERPVYVINEIDRIHGYCRETQGS